jgi:hypothetical protein
MDGRGCACLGEPQYEHSHVRRVLNTFTGALFDAYLQERILITALIIWILFLRRGRFQSFNKTFFSSS